MFIIVFDIVCYHNFKKKITCSVLLKYILALIMIGIVSELFYASREVYI